jgi:hypothetical protein
MASNLMPEERKPPDTDSEEDGKCSISIRDHSSITSSKMWVGGVRKWQFLMIYITVNHQRGGRWWALKSQNHDDVILEWFLFNRTIAR